MAVPLSYSLRNLVVRRTTTAATVIGIALAVFMFVLLGALSIGMSSAISESGSPLNVVFTHKGTPPEWSDVTREQYDVVRYLEGVVPGVDGQPAASAQYVNTIWLPRGHGEPDVLVVLRGVEGNATDVNQIVQIQQGELPTSGSKIAVGRFLAGRLGIKIGDQVKFGRREWTVSGIFTAHGSSFESEIWGPLNDFMDDFKRDALSSVIVRVADQATADRLVKSTETDKRLSELEAKREDLLYAEGGQMVRGLYVLGGVVSVIMGIGAVFAGMNTLYASVAARIREVGTLRTLGYRRRSILLAFVAEAMVIALLGGVLGVGLGVAANGLSTNMMGIIFQAKVTPALAAAAMGFALLIGLVGGLLPALQAARTPISEALRRS